jgi:hypothetical protein
MLMIAAQFDGANRPADSRPKGHTPPFGVSRHGPRGWRARVHCIRELLMSLGQQCEWLHPPIKRDATAPVEQFECTVPELNGVRFALNPLRIADWTISRFPCLTNPLRNAVQKMLLIFDLAVALSLPPELPLWLREQSSFRTTQQDNRVAEAGIQTCEKL